MEMKKYKLGEIADIQTGPFGSQLHNEDYVSEGTPIVTVEHLGNKFFTTQNLPLVSDNDKKRLKKYILKESDIVFSRVGSVDRCSFVSIKEAGWLFSGRCLRVRPNEHLVNPQWLYYFFTQNNFKEYVRNKAVGCTMPSLNTELLSNLSITHPELDYQQKIAAVLSSLDDKIALNNRINAKLEQMAKRLYDYWFVQFDFPRSVSGEPCLHELSRTDDGNARSDFPNADGKLYKSTGGKMVWNEELKREIPERWEVKSIFDAADVIYGFPYVTEPFDENVEESNKPYSIIRIRDILENSISAKTTESVDDKYKTKIGDLLIGMDGYFHMNFWSRDNDYVNQRIVRIRKKDVSTLILYHQVLPFIKFKEEKAKGSTVGHLSDKDMKQIKVLIPNNKDLNVKFDTILSMMMARRQENLKLTAVRDKLLPLLMNGQVVVK